MANNTPLYVPPREQLYPVPENWRWVRLGEITEIVGGGTPSTKNSDFYENGNVPWITPADLSGYTEKYISHGARNITNLGLEKSSAQLFPKDTVCLSTRAPIGYVVIAKNTLSTNQGFKSFLPSPAYLPSYLYWYLKGNKDLLVERASGTTFLELSGRKAAAIEFPLPPFPEQQRIVDRIESLFSKLDAAREKAQAVVDGYESRRAAILHKAFTGELTAKWREERGISLDSWKNGILGNYADTQYGYTQKSSLEVIGPKFLRITDIQNGSVSWDDVPYCEIDDNIKENYQLNIGDIVIARTGATTGKSYIITDKVDSVYASYLIRVTVNQPKFLSSQYLYCFMQCPLYWNQISDFSVGIAQPGVNGKKIRMLQLPIPLIDEQIEIVRILNDIFEQERRMKEAAETVLENIDMMKKAILGRAFRGLLGTNNPAESGVKTDEITGG